MKNIGILWDEEVDWEGSCPAKDSINESYGFFSDVAEAEGVKVFMAHFSWYEGGVLEKAWRFEDGEWCKVNNVSLDGVYDKFRFDDETREVKERMVDEVGILNVPEVEELCKDKLMTYERFSDLVPETRKASRRNVEEMLGEFGKAVVKPRYAFGGRGIEILERGDEVSDVDQDEYIVQRFVDSSEGIEGIIDGRHDIRAIVANGELLGGYIRFDDELELMNVSQGASKKPMYPDDFTDEMRDIVDRVWQEIDVEPAVLSVDFFVDSDGETWIVELNSKPGLGYYGDEEMKKVIEKVIHGIVGCLKQI